MKLHIGCGIKNFGDNWIHIDGSNYDHIDYYNIKKLEFKDDSIDLIYSSHTLEYFDREEVLDVLTEWRRVLKKDGILRLSVPDFRTIARLYTEGKYSLEKFLGPLYGKWKMKENTIIYHRTTYDYDSLKNVLLEVGFQEPLYWDWRKTEHSNHDDYSQAYLPHMEKENGIMISLNIEVKK